jgi:hypothetical protein
LASKYAADHLPSGVERPDQILRHHKELEVENNIREGKPVDLSYFNPTEQKRIRTYGKQDRLQARFDRLGIDDALDVWEIASPEEKQRLQKGLLKKATSAIQKMTSQERADSTAYHRLVQMGLARPVNPSSFAPVAAPSPVVQAPVADVFSPQYKHSGTDPFADVR